MKPSCKQWMRGGLMALACFWNLQAAQAQILGDGRTEPWVEAETPLPSLPLERDLIPFYVSATTPNTFLVDGRTLGIGEDGVVRYVLLIRTPGGAENVSFEGVRCETLERRIYAIGRQGAWVSARNSAWVPIVFNSYNRHQAALAQEYLCDGPMPVKDVAEARRRLGLR